MEMEWTTIVATLFAYLLYCLKIICCIIDEQLVVFVGEQFVVLVVLFACVVIITSQFIIDLFRFV
jgi:hypothetical protein